MRNNIIGVGEETRHQNILRPGPSPTPTVDWNGSYRGEIVAQSHGTRTGTNVGYLGDEVPMYGFDEVFFSETRDLITKAEKICIAKAGRGNGTDLSAHARPHAEMLSPQSLSITPEQLSAPNVIPGKPPPFPRGKPQTNPIPT